MLPDGWWISAESGLPLACTLWRKLEEFGWLDAQNIHKLTDNLDADLS